MLLRAAAGISLLLASAVNAMPTHVVYTLPTMGQYCYKIWSEEDADSVRVCDCTGTEPIHHLQMAYLYKWAPGGFAVIDSHSVVGMEGMPDSFAVSTSGNYYIRTRNDWLSCPSNVATVMPDVVTGITEDATPPARRQRWYNVHGQMFMTKPKASGVYWWQYNLNGTKWSKPRKDVIVR